MYHLFESRDYEARILGDEASPGERLLEELVDLGSDGISDMALYFSGHGTDDGLAVGDGMLLVPDLLYEMLTPLDMTKRVIIDACHAGLFVDHVVQGNAEELSDYLVMASCPADSTTGVSLRNTHVGGMTYGLWRALKRVDQPMDLTTLEISSSTGLDTIFTRVENFFDARRGEPSRSYAIQRIADRAIYL